ncbi:MAG: NAD-dependent epimerase/dehydratase family protein [Anaerolineae bacterium]|jgi:dihydroflavonol-4-reductase|nr:NAD-dependent epimerase/dehydratase family protein [Anaerolineae bacterium]
MRAFVTGGTGLLGSNVVSLLLAQGHEVLVLARSAAKAAQLLPAGVTVLTGDMADVPAFAHHLAGVDVVFHTAAYFREYFSTGDHRARLEQINVQATMQLLNAAEAQGVKKVIYVSSSGVIGLKPGGLPGDETTPPDAHTHSNLYFHSKVLAEEAISAWLQTHRLPVVLILPTAIFGPGDSGPTGAGQMILDALTGRLPAIPPGGLSVVDVREVAQAMVNAVERGRSGERYIINHRYYSIGEILALLERLTGIPGPRLPLPYPLALLVATGSELVSRLTGTEPQITVNAIRTLGLRREVRTDKAQRELGIQTRPFEETLRDEVDWFARHGYIKDARVLGQLAHRAR